MLLTSVYLTMLQTQELSGAQLRLEEFCLFNSNQLSEQQGLAGKTSKDRKAKKKSSKKINRHEVRIRSTDQMPKIMIVIGDTLVVRDYILSDLKPRYNLSVQKVPATLKRSANMFKSQIFDGSQCNAKFKENGFLTSMLLNPAPTNGCQDQHQ